MSHKVSGLQTYPKFAPPGASRSSAGVSSTRWCEFMQVCSCLELIDEGVGARICICLFWSFGVFRASAMHAGINTFQIPGDFLMNMYSY